LRKVERVEKEVEKFQRGGPEFTEFIFMKIKPLFLRVLCGSVLE